MSKLSKNKVLVVVAHPDDEVLGAGGTLCAHRDAGAEIAILILANGEDGRGQAPPAVVDKRLGQAKAVAEKWRAKLTIENLPDNAFDTVSLLSIAKLVERAVSEFQPNLVYTHNPTDLNVDHRLTCQAVMTACRPQPGFCVKEILAFEVLSSTEWQVRDRHVFSPNYYNNIEKYLEEKTQLMAVYRDELRAYPHPRSLEGVKILARFRGLEVGIAAAEAFMILRKIEN